MPEDGSPSSSGRGALGAADELEGRRRPWARRSSRRCSGKAAVPDDSPYTTGGIGLLGTKPSQEAMENCDTLLMIGTSFPYIEFLPKAGTGARRADRVGPDADRTALSRGGRAGRRLPADFAGADPAAQAQRRSRVSGAGAGRHAEWWELMEDCGSRTDKPMKPQVVAWELGKRLRRGRHRLLRFGNNRDLVGAANSAPSAGRCIRSPAISPQWRPACRMQSRRRSPIRERQCVAFVGDGGFSMLMAEFATASNTNCRSKFSSSRTTRSGRSSGSRWYSSAIPEYGCELAADRFRRVCPGMRRHGIDDRGSRPIAARFSTGAGHTRARAGRGGCGSSRAADAAEGHVEQAANFAESLAGASRTEGRSLGRFIPIK